MTDNAADTFPGWYPDPRGEADQRFWNGREWTPNTRVDVPAAQFIPATPAEASETPTPAPVAPKRVEADVPNGSVKNGATEKDAGARNGVAEPAKARIFGGPPSGKTSTATKVAAKPEPAKLAPAKKEPAVAEVAESESNKNETTKPVAEPVAEPKEAGEQATSSNSLFGKTDQPSAANSKAASGVAGRLAGLDEESRELTKRIDSDSLLHKTANRPAATIAPQPMQAASGILGKLLGAVLVSLLIGGLIGWAIGRSGNDSPVPNEQASVSTTDGSTSTSAEQADNTETTVDATDEADGATAELQTTVDDLSAELEAAGAEVDALTVERDNALEHNGILQTWFTADVRANSERAWELGVQQACDAEADPTIENTNYTRAMELIGTHADLVTAALVCRAEG